MGTKGTTRGEAVYILRIAVKLFKGYQNNEIHGRGRGAVLVGAAGRRGRSLLTGARWSWILFGSDARKPLVSRIARKLLYGRPGGHGAAAVHGGEEAPLHP